MFVVFRWRAVYIERCTYGSEGGSFLPYYGWRGADIRNILDFEKDFKNTKVIKLEQNYRSTQNILDVANNVIDNNINRKGKNLWTSNNIGCKIKLYKSMTDLEEASFISSKINELVKEDYCYNDMVVLYRTNAQSRVIEDSLVRSSIPYRLFGGVRFYERREIKDVLAYLRAINNPKDDIAFLRIINVPKRGIGLTTVEKIQQYSVENDISFYNSLLELDLIPTLGNNKKLKLFIELMEQFREYSKVLNVSELIDKILKDTGYLESLIIEGEDIAEGRIDNINELKSKASEFEINSEDKSLQAFLEEVSLVADIDNFDENEDTVALMTMHNSKGLEFPCVFLAGFEEGIFPSYRSIVQGEDKIEEERRLCYVAITRAEKELYLLCANSRMQNGSTVFNSPSRFLKEIPIDFIENLNKKNKTSFKKNVSVNMMNNYEILKPKNIDLDFEVGDKVKQKKYGIGVVKNISPAGADYEVTVEFEDVGRKKFMANLSKLQKI